VSPSAAWTDSGNSDTVEPEGRSRWNKYENKAKTAKKTDGLHFNSVTLRGKYQKKFILKSGASIRRCGAKAITERPPKQKNKARLCF